MRNRLLTLLTVLLLSGCTSSPTPSSPDPIIPDEVTISRRIFVLWDSLSAGYQLPYEDSYPAQLESKLRDAGYSNIQVINWWESGDTSEWLLSRLWRVTADAQSGDIALIVIGGNDGLRGLSTDALADNIKNIISDLQSREIQTIIGGMQIPTNLGESYRTAFAEIYPRIAEQTDSILIPFILSGVAGIPELNLRDGIHPNTEWQAIVAQTVFEVVVDIITD